MKRLHPSLLLISISILAYQIILMYTFSITQWYHFASMVISIALLGFGASGTVIALARTWLLKHGEFVCSLSMVCSGIMMMLALPLMQADLFRFDSHLVLFEPHHVLSLVLTYLLLFTPFFFGALSIGLIFVKEVKQIGSLYFANLIGSGIGGVFTVGLSSLLFVQQLFVVSASVAIVAGLLSMPRQNKRPIIVVVVLGLGVIGVIGVKLPPLQLSQYKSLSKSLLPPQSKIVSSEPTSHGLLQVVSSPTLRYAPGLSLSYQKEVPRQETVFNNGDRYGAIIAWSRRDTNHLLDFTTLALPYAIRQPARVLDLFAATGISTAHALTHGARSVTAVEPHTGVIDLIRHECAPLTDSLFHHPLVTVSNLDPRTHLMKDTSHYDLIQLPLIDAFGGTMGLFALKEQYGMTKEAMREMWNRLNAEGMISISTWMDFPLRNPIKALATIAEVLEEEGIVELSNHIMAVRSWGTVTFVVSRSRFNPDEIAAAREFCSSMLFDPALLPDIATRERVLHNAMTDDTFFILIDFILSGHREIVLDRYDFDIRPATDERPFFSQFLRWRTIPHLREVYGDQAFPFLEIGYLVVVVTALQLLVISFLLIVLPLLKIGWRGRHKGWTLFYFGALGAGFMFVEIVLINRFTLYFGQPIHAAAAVLSGLLVCAGIGSYASARFAPTPKNLRTTTLVVVALLLAYAFFLMPFLEATLSLPFGLKILTALAFIAPLGFVMGIPFPLGLRFLGGRSEAQLPWAWGINGCLSVVGTALALIAAVELGFVLVTIIAAGLYGLASLSNTIPRWSRQP
ncbi:MAG: spermidine synthase-like protein [Ignavibacteria bacterium]|nr:spermidine synthase-like protein [Ignavibacteria bacterium]